MTDTVGTHTLLTLAGVSVFNGRGKRGLRRMVRPFTAYPDLDTVKAAVNEKPAAMFTVFVETCMEDQIQVALSVVFQQSEEDLEGHSILPAKPALSHSEAGNGILGTILVGGKLRWLAGTLNSLE